QVDIRQPRLVAEAEALVADQLLDSCQTLANPMGDPLVDLGLVMAQLAQLLEHADVVQRVDVAADDRRHATYLGARLGIDWQQRRLWMNLFQVLDDRRRLHQQCAAVGTQGRHAALGIERQVARRVLLALQQVHRQGLVIQALERQGDSHPIRGGGTVVGKQLHRPAPQLAARILPRHSPKPMLATPSRLPRPRRMLSSPSSRNLRTSPLASSTGCLPPSVISSRLPKEPGTAPDRVPEPNRSPGCNWQPLTLWWATICATVQYMLRVLLRVRRWA